MVEKCVCLILQQVESLQRDLTPPLPPTNFDTKELSSIRGGLSFGYAMKGEGVTESIIRSKDHGSFVEPKPKPRETAKIYHVCFDHQLEPQDYGNFSTFDKAHNFLVNDRELDIRDIAKYGTTTIYKTSHGDYRIEEKVLV